jgi:hypothetical protein
MEQELDFTGFGEFVSQREQYAKDTGEEYLPIGGYPALPPRIKLPDPENFRYLDCFIGGDECWLITPLDMATKWDDDNARFRSCVVRKSDNFVVSQGFGKFTNFGERPDFQPWDNSWKIEARHKIDGSLLIVSKYKGELIVRTRGTVDARQLGNGHEIDLIIQKYPHAFDNLWLDRGHTILYEWTTPTNIIVLREHDIPTITLVGAVRTQDCKYLSQSYLDSYAETICVNRPEKYEYNSIEACILDVSAWRGKEGVVLYSPDGQTLKKIKADEYCELHKLATGIKGVKQVLDVFMTSPKFTKSEEFYNYIETTLDFEIAEKCEEYIKEICEAYCNVLDKIKKADNLVEGLRGLTRKEQAIDIQQHYSDWRVGYCFSALDGKEMDDKTLRKAIEKELNG